MHYEYFYHNEPHYNPHSVSVCGRPADIEHKEFYRNDVEPVTRLGGLQGTVACSKTLPLKHLLCQEYITGREGGRREEGDRSGKKGQDKGTKKIVT